MLQQSISAFTLQVREDAACCAFISHDEGNPVEMLSTPQHKIHTHGANQMDDRLILVDQYLPHPSSFGRESRQNSPQPTLNRPNPTFSQTTMPIFGSTSNKTDQVVPNSTHHHGTAIPPQEYSTMPVGVNTMGAGGNRVSSFVPCTDYSTYFHISVDAQSPTRNNGPTPSRWHDERRRIRMVPTTRMGHYAGGMGHHNGAVGIPPAPTPGTTDPDIPSPEKSSASLVSSSLKAKGIQKEQEAKAAKVQSSELAEAERLEAEALMRRERAVTKQKDFV
ncbi:hypothetical protein C8J56DRAFT_1075975 [Mycena floridula]|nr:hypothetical protein C8J56DRAFT_1075975 [Mycena floridula]